MNESVTPISMDALVHRLRALSAPMAPVPTGEAPRCVSLEGIACVLFDVYGTLFVSGSGDVGTAGVADQDDVLHEALKACGIQAPTDLSASRLTEAIQRVHAEARQAGIDYPEVDILAVWDEVLGTAGYQTPPGGVPALALEYEARINPVWPMPGLEDTLAAVQARQIKMGIVSNAQFFTPLLFPAFTGHRHVDLGFAEALCVWSYRYRKAKPSKELFRQVLTVLEAEGIQPSHTLYVGNDMRNDIAPAAALGCRTALFAGDQRSLRWRTGDPAVSGVQPDLILTDLRQLLDCL